MNMTRPFDRRRAIGIAALAAIGLAIAAPAVRAQGPGAQRPVAAEISVKIYPIPANESVTVDLDSIPGTAQAIVISDIRGAEWIRHDVATGATLVQLSTAELPAGVYVLTVTTSTTTATARLVVEH